MSAERLLDVADVLTSSGHGGRFSFGVISRKQVSANAELMDRAFDDAFGVKTRKTLTINCLPMGVVFSSHCMTVATTSVREDMAVALVETFGHHYEQIVLCGDPLFMKRFTDYARERGADWSRYRVNIMMGEEIFGEQFRGYLAACVGLNLDRPEQGYIASSFGVGELGLHLCYETPATISLRRASLGNPAFARDLLGAHSDDGATLPMIFTFNPLRTFIEVVDPDGHGYGAMTTSMLDPERTVPLLRYQTGDVVRLLDHAHVTKAARRHGVAIAADLPQALARIEGPRKGGVAERVTRRLLQGRPVCRSSDCALADRRLPHDVFRRTVHHARPTGLVADSGRRRSSRAFCARCRRRYGRSAWCCGRMPGFPSAWAWTTSASSSTTFPASRILARMATSHGCGSRPADVRRRPRFRQERGRMLW